MNVGWKNLHYMWVARRCLPLLDESSGLSLVTIEGVSAAEATEHQNATGNSEDIIDVGEYFGGEDSQSANEIHYYQLLLAFSIDDSLGNFREQQRELRREAAEISPGTDDTVSAQLLELVFDRIMPDRATDPAIRRSDVLRALGTDLDESLFPAPSLVSYEEPLVPREQEEVFRKMLSSKPSKAAIHAEGGLGKTSVAFRLVHSIPSPGIGILYDCFGNGEYRNRRRERFGQRSAYTQMANELAAKGLCLPLIPHRSATNSELLDAFLSRLAHASMNARLSDPEAHIYIFIDTADNAEMAAEEFNLGNSFVKDLAREALPQGVTCVFLAWTSRLSLLDLPPEAPCAELHAFTRAETAALLRTQYSDANENDIDEFHYLTSATPRVQAIGLSKNLSLPEMLIAFGPNPVTAKEAIRDLFETAILKLRHDLPEKHRTGIDRLCAAIAALRPFVPISVLSVISNVPEAQIRNFVRNIGRPFAMNGDAIQFFDEPSESWFRERYAPEKEQLSSFVDMLQPFATQSNYVAAALPELLHRTGRDAELVEDILAERGLPNSDPVDSRSIAVQRMRFALKSALSDKRYEDAGKLALKLGGETAGEGRQNELIQSHSHLFGRTMLPDQQRELVARRPFSTSWHGGHFVYSASLLSWNEETRAEARTHIRAALYWLKEWARRTNSTDNQVGSVSNEDAAALAIALLNVEGVESFNHHIQGWTSRSRIHLLSRIVCQQLGHLGKWDILTAIGEDDSTSFPTRLAVIETLFENQMLPSLATSEKLKLALRLLRRLPEEQAQMNRTEPVTSYVAVGIALAFRRYNLLSDYEIAQVIKTFAPAKQTYANVWGLQRVFLQKCTSLAVIQRLAGEHVTIADMLDGDLRKKWEKTGHSQVRTRDMEFFRLVEGSIMPWCQLRADILLGKINVDDAITLAGELSKSTLTQQHQTPHDAKRYEGSIASLWAECLEWCGAEQTIESSHLNKFMDWVRRRKDSMYTPALFRIARICSRVTGLEDFAYEVINFVGAMIRESDEGVESLIDAHMSAATTLYATDVQESKLYLDKVASVADEVGQENIDRLLALLQLGEAGGKTEKDNAALAYRLARVSEFSYTFMARDKYWQRNYVIRAVSALSPPSLLAILARWRDRSFGGTDRLLVTARKVLSENGHLCPEDAAVLMGFQSGWCYSDLVRPILPYLATRPIGRQEVATYTLLAHEGTAETFSDEEWAQLTGGESRPISATSIARSSNSSASLETEPDPSQVTLKNLNGLNLNNEVDIEKAKQIVLERLPYSYDKRLAELLFENVTPGKRLDRLEALFNSNVLSTYTIATYLNAIPSNWLRVDSFKRGLHKLILLTIGRDPSYLGFFPYGQDTLLDRMVIDIGMRSRDIFVAALKARVAWAEDMGSGSLFGIVNLISKVLNAEEACRVLNYGLTLIEPLIDNDKPDGNWDECLNPKTDTIESLSGYIWNALASPHRPDRWQGMHATALTIILERSELLDGICSRFEKKDTRAFHDARFDIRETSAEIAFLHVIRRAIAKDWKLSNRIFELLKAASNTGEMHLLKRWLIADCLLRLDDIGEHSLTPKDRERLENICSYGGPDLFGAPDSAGDNKEENKERHYFGHDMDRWVNDMQTAFGLEYYAAQDAVMTEMNALYDHEAKPIGKRDPRNSAGVYRGRSTWERKYEHPEAEDAQFYRTVHALMHVAGKTLDQFSSKATQDSTQKVKQWLSDYLPSDPSGRWRFDWRDKEPAITWNWQEKDDDRDWSRSITKADLLTPIVADGNICAEANITMYRSGTSREVNISVSSALVSPGSRAFSLARALQTIADSSDFRLPDEEDLEFEINTKGYLLKGWTRTKRWRQGIDHIDPWAGKVTIPGIIPASDL